MQKQAYKIKITVFMCNGSMKINFNLVNISKTIADIKIAFEMRIASFIPEYFSIPVYVFNEMRIIVFVRTIIAVVLITDIQFISIKLMLELIITAIIYDRIEPSMSKNKVAHLESILLKNIMIVLNWEIYITQSSSLLQFIRIN